MNCNRTQYWLSVIGIGLILLHLNLSQHFGTSGFSSHGFLFWMVLVLLLWQKRDRLDLTSDRISSFLGILCLTIVLYKSLHLFPKDFFVRISPLLSFFGYSLEIYLCV